MKVKFKISMLWILSLILLLVGCSTRSEPMSSDKETTASTELHVNISKEGIYKGTYYKTELEKASYDESAILKYLIGDFDKNEILNHNTSEGNESSVEIDDVKHTWMAGENTLIYYNNVNDNGSISESEALNQSNAFVETLGFDIDENPTIKEEAGKYMIEYALLYKGTRVLGNKIAGMQEIQGEYVSVTVSGTGINGVEISNIMKPTQVLETYDAEADFIAPDKLHQMNDIYFEKMYSELGEDIPATFSIKNINVIYMPYMEENIQILIPVLELEVISEIEGSQITTSIIMDAITGYIY